MSSGLRVITDRCNVHITYDGSYIPENLPPEPSKFVKKCFMIVTHAILAFILTQAIVTNLESVGGHSVLG